MDNKIDVPGSLAGRTGEGRWRKLLLFVGHRFLPRPGKDYRFGGGALLLPEPLDLHGGAEPVLTVVDPVDGERWHYAEGKWSRVGSLIA